METSSFNKPRLPEISQTQSQQQAAYTNWSEARDTYTVEKFLIWHQ